MVSGEEINSQIGNDKCKKAINNDAIFFEDEKIEEQENGV
jgi:hypothetical protein